MFIYGFVAILASFVVLSFLYLFIIALYYSLKSNSITLIFVSVAFLVVYLSSLNNALIDYMMQSRINFNIDDLYYYYKFLG